MAEITERGKKLADKLNPFIGTTHEIMEICSLICRHERTYHRIQEMWASVEMNDDETTHLENEEVRIEKRITDLVERLPHTDEGPIGVILGGDPRGAVVKLTLPGSLAIHHDTWGRDGIDIP